MFQRLLAPVDFTPRSRRAAGVAVRLAAGSKGEVTLLHVIERIDAGAPGAFAGFYRKLERSARRKLEEMRSELLRKGIDVGAEVVYGRRLDEILRFAESRRIDLIVLASHKLALRRGEAWGTISYRVGLLAPCPVLLVK
jgi:universal stress protein A